MRFSSLPLLPLTLTLASPLTLSPRAVIPHDAVTPLPQTVPGGATGAQYLAYKPHLQVVNGCVPFPGVDAQGNTSGGLSPTGATNGGCSSSTGQVYVRRGTGAGGRTALMYSWYFPKDEPLNGVGHRHDWEGVIIWLASPTSTAPSNILAVCPSAHGDWNCATTGYTLSGTSPLIAYQSIFPLDHSMGLTSTVGGTQPLVAWESLPAAAQNALQSTDFGDAIVPFKDSTFANNLAEATF